MAVAFTEDDVVASWDEVREDARPPLIVVEGLASFLEEIGLGTGELELSPLGDGHSNVTVRIQREGVDLVLRRPPRPPVPPSAHDMVREAKVVSALHGTDVPVAKIRGICNNADLIGVPFYVMDTVEGEPIGDTVPPEVNTEEDHRRIGLMTIETLAAIHAVDWESNGLGDLARHSGYLERQVRRFLQLWELNRTRDLPKVEAVAKWLTDSMPDYQETTVVHGDYRLGNILVASDPLRMSAVVDWEMATLGDPLADLGFLIATWSQAGDPPLKFALSPATASPGFPTRRQLIEDYVSLTGRSAEHLSFYATLALWKSIIFMEGNYKRAIMGGSDDPFLLSFGDGVSDLADRAWEMGPGGGFAKW